jgi:GNAT superfamily N-acetyltransferase/signal transduction histidine kinase
MKLIGNVKFKIVKFKDLDSNHIKTLKKINSTATFSDSINSFETKGYIFNEIDFKILKKLKDKGRVFFIKNGENVVGYSICFENLDGKWNNFEEVENSNYFEHEINFLKELNEYKFAYIDQIVIKGKHRTKGYGKRLLEEVENYYKDKQVEIIGAIIHAKNYFPLLFFKKRGYTYLDFYTYEYSNHPKYKGREELWVRIAKSLSEISPEKINDISSKGIFLKFQSLKIFNLLPENIKSKIGWFGWLYYEPVVQNSVDIPLSDFVFYHSYVKFLEDFSGPPSKVEIASVKFKEGMQRILEYYYLRQEGRALSIIPYISRTSKAVILYSKRGKDKDIIGILNNLKTQLKPEIINLDFGKKTLLGKISNFCERESKKWIPWLDMYTKSKDSDFQNQNVVLWIHILYPMVSSSRFMVGCFITYLLTKDDLKNKNVDLLLPIFLISSYFSMLISILKRKIIINYALQSGILEIMSRNMSHNIGSHILFYLKMEKLMDLFLKIVSKNRISYKDLSPKIQVLIEKLNLIQNNLNSSLNSVKDTLVELERLLKSLSADIRWGILEWIEDTKTFFGYLQQRMDFLAQVSTEWPKWTFSAYLMKNIIRNFLMQRHLLDGIAKSEGLRGFYYEWEEPYKKYLECKSKLEKSNEKKEEKKVGRIKIHVFNLSKIGDVKDNQVKELWNKKHKSIYVRKKQLNNSRVLLYSSDKDSHINIEKDIPIAIPGGITGYHALYVIIENIIRNSAKHGYAKKRGNKGDLEIVIEFTDDFKEPYNYWRFRIYDNVSKIESRISQNKRFRIFDVNEKNKTPETDLVAFMNECLRHSLIKETGEIDRRHWGMAEMKIAAGYLQMRDVQDIGEKDDKITGSMKDQNGEKEDFIIRAIESPIETLGFEFKVKKPKEVGIVFYGGIK